MKAGLRRPASLRREHATQDYARPVRAANKFSPSPIRKGSGANRSNSHANAATGAALRGNNCGDNNRISKFQIVQQAIPSPLQQQSQNANNTTTKLRTGKSSRSSSKLTEDKENTATYGSKASTEKI